MSFLLLVGGVAYGYYAYIYNIESEADIDIRKSLFYMFAEKNWPLVGIEPLGMSLEDIFVAIVDQTDGNRYERKGAQRAPRRNRAEQEIAKNIAEKKKGSAQDEFSALFGDDDEK